MIKKVVFLSGPMRGIDRKEGIAWRQKAEILLRNNFQVLQAYRGREKEETFTDPRGAVIRDKNDIIKSEIVLVNDTYDNLSMIGTSMEVLYAHSLDKVVIVFGKAHSKDYWLNYHSHIRTDTLEEACQIINNLFID